MALRWIAGTPIQRFTSFFGGGAGAYYGTPYMQSTMGTDSGLTGFLLGLFGMALVSKLFDAIAVMNFGERIERLLTKWGL